MVIKTLDELREADGRTLPFGSFGLGGRLRPEDAAELQQRTIAGIELAPEVADGTRQTFERLRTVYAYGVLCYDLYTMVGDQALLVIEQALRDRFLEFHSGTITFVDRAGTEYTTRVTSYEDVYKAAKRATRGSAAQRRLLRVGSGKVEFNGMLDGLRRWARAAGLLRGQRSRGIEGALAKLRNFVAHPIGYQLDTPVDAARMLHDLAEIINQLWGRATPGGRLYAAPVPRDVTAIGWSSSGRISIGHAQNLLVDAGDDDREYVLVRAVFYPGEREDPHLMEYDARYETTAYPTQLLWGPGSRGDAAQWLKEHQPQPDTCDHLDRVFLVRHQEGRTLTPMRPQVAAALSADQRSGTWYTIRADYPSDAFAHARALSDKGTGHNHKGDCRACHTHTLAVGSYDQALAAATTALGPVTPEEAPDVCTPLTWNWPIRPSGRV